MAETLLDPLFYINVGKDGTFKSSGNYKSSPANIDALFDYLTTNNIQSLVIYFHGGLVSEKSGMNAATLMKGTFHDITGKRHVVSFVWETGPWEVLSQNLDTFFKQDLIKTILMKIIKIVAKKLNVSIGDRSVGGYISDTTINAELAKKEPFVDISQDMTSRGGVDVTRMDDARLQNSLDIEAGVVFTFQEKQELEDMNFDDVKFLKPEHKDTANPADRSIGAIAIIKAVAKVSYKVIKRYINKTDHDFYPTVIEEILREFYIGGIGSWGWTEIKSKAKRMFLQNTNRAGDELYAGEYFLAKLKDHINSGRQLTITLIGHSAGAIAISHLIEAVKARHHNLIFNQLFFLAPACRVDLFQKHIEPAIGTTISSFRMFTMKMQREKEDHCVPVVYTRSLLYLVSGLFETTLDASGNEKEDIDAKILGLHEHFLATGRYSSFSELSRLNQFLSANNRLVLSDDNLNADIRYRSVSLKHGNFDNDEVTLTAIKSSL